MSKKLRIVISVIMLAAIGFTAVPKVYFHKLMGHTHISAPTDVMSNGNVELKDNKNTQDCDIDKFETPVYFTIFKFILNCNPFKSSAKISDNYQEKSPSSRKIIVSQLRAPPLG
ncbi:MAG: hypothetical protein ACJ76F_03485 [Bacteroidia bacterium]